VVAGGLLLAGAELGRVIHKRRRRQMHQAIMDEVFGEVWDSPECAELSEGLSSAEEADPFDDIAYDAAFEVEPYWDSAESVNRRATKGSRCREMIGV
jgi:hypothetical protein